MKTFTRVGLPIILVAAAVFGITFIRMYSPPAESKTSGGANGGTGASPTREPALKFFTTKAVAPNPKSKPNHLWYWQSTIEVGAPGHFEFWCQNRHPQPVTIRVPATNCQCAGAELSVVPHDTLQEYFIESALLGSPLCAAPNPLAALVHMNFERRLTWLPLYKDGDRPDQIIPAASPAAGPQFALVRLAWKGKGEPGGKGISAQVYASIGDELPSSDVLSADMTVIQGFQLFQRSGSQWKSAHEMSLGELRENSTIKKTIFLASYTRPYLLYTIAADRPTPCITWSDAVPATDEEMASLSEHDRASEHSLRQLRSLYKLDITVQERTETSADGRKEFHQLDLGPVDRKLSIAGSDAGYWVMILKGRVLGEITVFSGAEGGRIDLSTFAADQGISKEVVLLAERPGLDLSLVESEITPNYLKAKLEPLPSTTDGRKKWRLRVTVPERALYGSLPETSGIVLKMSGTSTRRMRIPVRGRTYDSGGKRL